MPAAVVQLQAKDVDARIDDLASLLQETVAEGGGVGFLAPLADAPARAYWRGVAAEIARGERVLLALLDDDALVGCVQLALATRETGIHRADVQKLMIRADAKRQGHATRLMEAIEREALALGRTLLLLDTFAGSPGDALYTKLGWTRVGEIPRYARTPAGDLAALALYWKEPLGARIRVPPPADRAPPAGESGPAEDADTPAAGPAEPRARDGAPPARSSRGG